MTREEIFNRERLKPETIESIIEEYWIDMEQRKDWSKDKNSKKLVEALNYN